MWNAISFFFYIILKFLFRIDQEDWKINLFKISNVVWFVVEIFKAKVSNASFLRRAYPITSSFSSTLAFVGICICICQLIITTTGSGLLKTEISLYQYQMFDGWGCYLYGQVICNTIRWVNTKAETKQSKTKRSTNAGKTKIQN